MKISKLAERSGVSARSLRYYEQQGLLSPRRSSAGHSPDRTGRHSTLRLDGNRAVHHRSDGRNRGR
ncbi:MerR family DNA-binding transcriptional regulator [Janibacter melonis]|uniref:MerR family DNA-binding transcriptional regulator n=1 Tax=Janibacter melonis TaxID=262209 RepID=UPI0017828480|nr:MerR family DNA-binding transcriptional regulator [Janibacter melonis]